MKNILYLHNRSEISGGEQSLLALWAHIDRTRFTPHLIIPHDGGFKEAAEKSGVIVSLLPIPPLRPYAFRQLAHTIHTLWTYIRAHQIVLIHSYTPRNNIIAALLGRFCRIPVIWHERNMLFDDRFDASRMFSFLPTRIICNSRAVATRFIRWGRIPKKVTVVLNGVDLTQFHANYDSTAQKKKWGVPLDKKIVGIVTNFTRRKRLEYFLVIAALILENRDDTFFVVVGGDFADNNDFRYAEIKEKVAWLGISDSVCFTGFLNDVAPLISMFDISIHVAIKEACGRAILESMAAGKATIAINDGGTPELIEHGISGILVDPAPTDVRTFIDQLNSMLTDDARCREIGLAARKRAQHHLSIERNATQTETIYDELLKDTAHADRD